MSAATASRVAWSVWAMNAVCLGVAVALPSERGEGDLAGVVASLVFVLTFTTVGAVVASRRSSNPVGWLMCLSGLSYAVGGLAVSYIETGVVRLALELAWRHFRTGPEHTLVLVSEDVDELGVCAGGLGRPGS